MKVHTEHFDQNESGRNKVIVVGENTTMMDIPEFWDIFIFNSMKPHIKYFREHILRELENPQIIAAGDLLPKDASPGSPQTMFVGSGSLDNAGMTENGLGIEPKVFTDWKNHIEDAINKMIQEIKENADRTSSPGR